jgi:threonylcarbamoyladenosine tRNA methylthiotransferase MtaB
MGSFAITTLGCKVNRYESESISEQLLGQGWTAANESARADLCIVNTCTVTGKAATQSRQAVRRLMRAHPGSLVVVTGCYAQVAPEVFTFMEGVHHVVGTSLKDQIPRLASHSRGCPHPMSHVEDLSAPRPFKDFPISRFGNRTRPFLKIQDGCNSFCSYCVVPYARGRSRSLELAAVIERTRALAASGYSEVVLCGINVGKYGRNFTPGIVTFYRERPRPPAAAPQFH